MWRRHAGTIELLLGHFGGPMWRDKDDGAWAIPKGVIEPGESPEVAARREFEEELGHKAQGELVPLGRIRQRGGKYVEAFSMQGDLDPDSIISNNFTVEWPPRSGRFKVYPELDRVGWFTESAAREKILPSQVPLLDLFKAQLGRSIE